MAKNTKNSTIRPTYADTEHYGAIIGTPDRSNMRGNGFPGMNHIA